MLTQIHQYQGNGLVTVIWNFNIRIRNTDDFIPGVDDIIYRIVVHYKTNQYCDIFLGFLISKTSCLLNGWNFKVNDYTRVFRGCAVADYCLVPFEQISGYSNFDVIRATTLITEAVGVETMERITMPDHSLLLWSISLQHIQGTSTNNNEAKLDILK